MRLEAHVLHTIIVIVAVIGTIIGGCIRHATRTMDALSRVIAETEPSWIQQAGQDFEIAVSGLRRAFAVFKAVAAKLDGIA